MIFLCPAWAGCKWGPSLLWEYQNMKMKKLRSEANSEKGDFSGEGRLGENRELMDKNHPVRNRAQGGIGLD